jgi:hypothetical protein
MATKGRWRMPLPQGELLEPEHSSPRASKAKALMIRDIDIIRAAKQIIDQFPDDPVMEAAQPADAAYELGDMFNFDLWTPHHPSGGRPAPHNKKSGRTTELSARDEVLEQSRA